MTDSFSLFTETDIKLFRIGKHSRLFEKFGSHKVINQNKEGIYFAVWAPNAKSVSVIGEFNSWNRQKNKLKIRKDKSGIWEGFIEGLDLGIIYKYSIQTKKGETLEKIDPYALSFEIPPKTASVVNSTWQEWNDKSWMKKRHRQNSHKSAISIYEIHLGSWMRDPSEPHRWLTYIEIAPKLIEHVQKLGFTHVEFMPVMEHPYPPSWGYQITGYFAPTARYGTPQELMELIDALHQNHIGVILDWVPSHFPTDAHGLYQFDGTALYEYEDAQKGFHPDWKSAIFNFNRSEVRSFLLSNAFFWLERYHADGLRVDAVTSMLHLNYSRNEGEWTPNAEGGNENLEAISFLQELNETMYNQFPDILMVAEESSTYPGVTQMTNQGGLGFGLKWMMGWMNDTLDYFKLDPIFRKFHYHKLSFSIMYAFQENFLLPLSHDEVVHGKSPMLYKMPGDEFQRHANLRALYLYMFTHPGAKLMFMGDEFGQTSEWNFDHSLDWHLLQFEAHQKLMNFVSALNNLYRTESALYKKQFQFKGFEWLEVSDEENSVYAYVRKSGYKKDELVIVLNLSGIELKNYRLGFTQNAHWKCVLNSNSHEYWGSGSGSDKIKTEIKKFKGFKYSAKIQLPALSGLVFKVEKTIQVRKKAKSNSKN